MLSSNGSRVTFEALSVAWSTVALAEAFAEACFKKLATFVEAGELDL